MNKDETHVQRTAIHKDLAALSQQICGLVTLPEPQRVASQPEIDALRRQAEAILNERDAPLVANPAEIERDTHLQPLADASRAEALRSIAAEAARIARAVSGTSGKRSRPARRSSGSTAASSTCSPCAASKSRSAQATMALSHSRLPSTTRWLRLRSRFAGSCRGVPTGG